MHVVNGSGLRALVKGVLLGCVFDGGQQQYVLLDFCLFLREIQKFLFLYYEK